MRPLPIILGLLLALAVPLPLLARAEAPALLDAVTQIARPGLPGTVAVFGAEANAVVTVEGRAVVALAEGGRGGRIVAFGHGGYLGVDEADTQKLRDNAVAWAGKRENARVASFGQPGFRMGDGSAAEDLDEAQLRGRIRGLDVVVVNAHAVTPRVASMLKAHLNNGGGLIVAATGWGWEQLNPGKSIRVDFPMNDVLAKHGLAFTGLTIAGGSGPIEATASTNSNAGEALESLLSWENGDPPPSPAADVLQSAANAVLDAEPYVPAGSPLRAKLDALAERDLSRALVDGRGGQPEDAVTHALARVALSMDLRHRFALPPEEATAHPLASQFPGDVPDDAPRVTKTVSIDSAVPRWHSTGLYAAPGDVITISGGSKDLQVRIGAHSDKLYHLDRWQRAPEITVEQPLVEGTTQIANSFGGPIYIVVNVAGSGIRDVTIENAVEMPYFKLGETDPAEWRESIRHRPAPWAELACDGVILTVPSESARKLEDPTELMEHWQAVQDTNADLASIDRDRPYPERIVNDEQISAGYMHAGYPIMTWLDVREKQLDLSYLRSGEAWGFYHELGHNHQKPAWTWDGLGEVTCNWFSMYILETVCGQSPEEATSRSLTGEAKERLDAHLAAIEAAEESRWTSDPFLALGLYSQLRMEFGWEPFKAVTAAYEAMPDGEQPRTVQERVDGFAIRFSHAADRNVVPFLERWGLSVSESASAEVARLEVWDGRSDIP